MRTNRKKTSFMKFVHTIAVIAFIPFLIIFAFIGIICPDNCSKMSSKSLENNNRDAFNSATSAGAFNGSMFI